MKWNTPWERDIQRDICYWRTECKIENYTNWLTAWDRSRAQSFQESKGYGRSSTLTIVSQLEILLSSPLLCPQILLADQPGLLHLLRKNFVDATAQTARPSPACLMCRRGHLPPCLAGIISSNRTSLMLLHSPHCLLWPISRLGGIALWTWLTGPFSQETSPAMLLPQP